MNLPRALPYQRCGGFSEVHRSAIVVVVATLLVTTGALAAPKSTASPALFDEIANADQAMFGAFNAHDADKLAARFSDDLEFYHDKDGLQRKAATMASFRT